MRSSITLVAILAVSISLGAKASAQTASGANGEAASTAIPVGEDGASRVDPAVLDRCRREAAEQKLTDGPARTAFMGTCVAPED